MPAHDLDALRQLQGEIEAFITSLQHPIVVEDEIELFDLTAAQWRLTAGFGKLVLEVWNPGRSIARRVEDIAYRDRGRLGLYVRKPGARESMTLELRELHSAAHPERAANRTRFRQQLLSLLKGQFPGWEFERVSNRSDREHSFSGVYTRGLARQGRTAWAFLGLSGGESHGAVDAVLAYGLIWLDWLRSQSDRLIVAGLKLFLPPEAVEVTAHRATYLNRRAVQVEIFECDAQRGVAVPVDLRDFGNVQTRLVPRRQGEMLLERHREMLRSILGDLYHRVSVVADASGTFLSLRVLGLEVARVEGQIAPRVFFGLEGSWRRLSNSNQEELLGFLRHVLSVRHARSESRSEEFYRMQSERWLESLLVADISRVDPSLSRDHVHPQVPTFSGMDRGVIDILTITRAGRLAVVELKVEEEVNLPLQGLDYWLRVKWLHERGQFQAFGYFPGVVLAESPPALYLVSPAFRFHSTIERLVRYFDPSINITQVGLNNRWREAVKVLFRRTLPRRG